MSFLPKSTREEKTSIWFEEALLRAYRRFGGEQSEFIAIEIGTLRQLILEIIDDVMPPGA